MPASWGTPCDSSALRTIRLFGQRETWHVNGIEAVKYAELLANRTRYALLLRNRLEPADFQTYACRPIRGTSDTYSLHSWPRATDIRPSWNPMREDGVLLTDFDRFGYNDGIEFIDAFLKAGFRWGATWSHSKADAISALRRKGQKIRDGRVDPMHFELDAAPVTDGWVRRLRTYRALNPRYMSKVLSDAGVSTCEDLVRAWRAGLA